MLRFGVGGGGDDVEKVGLTSRKILATPLRVSFRNGEKRLFLVPEDTVITHRTSFELLSKILRNLCESGRDSLSSEAMNGSCDFGVEILWIVFNTLQQQSLIASLEMRSLLLVAV